MQSFESKSSLPSDLETVISQADLEDELPLEPEKSEFSSPLSTQELASRLELLAGGAHSIQSKSRALLLSSRLQQREQNQLKAEQLAREASSVAPKSALASLLHRHALNAQQPETTVDARMENLETVARSASSKAAQVQE